MTIGARLTAVQSSSSERRTRRHSSGGVEMPRKSNQHGGPRQGVPGTAYPQRTDLQQKVQAVPSQEYGSRVAQENAQRAIPLPDNVTRPFLAPGHAGALTRQSERSDEHVMSGS